MAYAEFTDRAGKSWRVWYTRPRLSEVLTILPEDWKEGWLTFESGDEKRRLAPVPTGWERLSPQRLELLCRVAEPTPLSPSAHDVLRREERRAE
jgi:hypothetical protein